MQNDRTRKTAVIQRHQHLTQNNHLHMATGAPGGSTIITTVLQIIT